MLSTRVLDAPRWQPGSHGSAVPVEPRHARTSGHAAGVQHPLRTAPQACQRTIMLTCCSLALHGRPAASHVCLMHEVATAVCTVRASLDMQATCRHSTCDCSGAATPCSASQPTWGLEASQQSMAAHAQQLAHLCTAAGTACSAGLWDATSDRHAHGVFWANTQTLLSLVLVRVIAVALPMPQLTLHQLQGR